MDSITHKLYHEGELDGKSFLETYFTSKTNRGLQEEILVYKMKQLHKELKSGRFSGETLIDISAGPSIYQLFTICEFFKDITILEFNESCVEELKKWVNKEPDAFDWSYTSTIHCDLDGKCDSWEEKEERVRKSIKKILKCDFTKENPTDPIVLPKADCLLCVNVLGMVSKDHDTYCMNLKKVSSMLKCGGHLLMFAYFNGTFYMVGGHKHHFLKYDEDFLRAALKQAGFTIEKLEMRKSQKACNLASFEHIVFVSAIKDREV